MTTCNECPPQRGRTVPICTACHTELCPHTAYYYTDESNAAITNNSGAWCHDCYGEQFGHRKEWVTESDLYWQTGGVLGVHNLLSSGDYEHRHTARARFTVAMTPHGSRVNS